MTEISALQIHINNYFKIKTIYDAYRQSGFNPHFFESHREAILLHKAAKDAFNKLEGKNVPSRQSLNEEFHRLLTTKKEVYAEYRQVKKEMQEYLIAKQTVEVIQGMVRKSMRNSNERQKKNNRMSDNFR